MFKPSPGIYRLLGAHVRVEAPEKLLKAYRRGESYLRKYKTFEILTYVVSLIIKNHTDATIGWNHEHKQKQAGMAYDLNIPLLHESYISKY